jgi:hypothetical protein
MGVWNPRHDEENEEFFWEESDDEDPSWYDQMVD